MKITNQDKMLISKMIEHYSELYPISDSAEYQTAMSEFEELCFGIDPKTSIVLKDELGLIEGMSSYHYCILGMKIYRAIGFMIDNPAQVVALLSGKDDTIIY